MEFLEPIWAFVKSFWEILALAATWAGIAVLAWRKRRNWNRKRFIDRVNFSLNYVEDDVLRLRTLLEDSADNVWLNDYGISLVRKAAEKTTVEQPFLRLAFARDMAFVKRAVLNVLSERFAPGFLARALGAEVSSGRFVFGITFERYGQIRTQKLRVIIMRRDELERVFGAEPYQAPGVAQPAHADRVTTLRAMHKLLRSSRERDRRMLGEVELALLTPGEVVQEQPPVVIPGPLYDDPEPEPEPERIEPMASDA